MSLWSELSGAPAVHASQVSLSENEDARFRHSSDTNLEGYREAAVSESSASGDMITDEVLEEPPNSNEEGNESYTERDPYTETFGTFAETDGSWLEAYEGTRKFRNWYQAKARPRNGQSVEAAMSQLATEQMELAREDCEEEGLPAVFAEGHLLQPGHRRWVVMSAGPFGARGDPPPWIDCESGKVVPSECMLTAPKERGEIGVGYSSIVTLVSDSEVPEPDLELPPGPPSGLLPRHRRPQLRRYTNATIHHDWNAKEVIQPSQVKELAEKCDRYSGYREGQVYQLGEKGLGYYRDHPWYIKTLSKARAEAVHAKKDEDAEDLMRIKRRKIRDSEVIKPILQRCSEPTKTEARRQGTERDELEKKTRSDPGLNAENTESDTGDGTKANGEEKWGKRRFTHERQKSSLIHKDFEMRRASWHSLGGFDIKETDLERHLRRPPSLKLDVEAAIRKNEMLDKMRPARREQVSAKRHEQTRKLNSILLKSEDGDILHAMPFKCDQILFTVADICGSEGYTMHR